MALTVHVVDRHEVAVAGVLAPGGDAVHLVGDVRGAHVSPRRVPRRPGVDDDDVAVPARPSAPGAQEAAADVEDHVVPAAFGHRAQDVDSELSAAAVIRASAIAPLWFVDNMTRTLVRVADGKAPDSKPLTSPLA